MATRFFLDTNIFVYTFDASASAKRKRAAQLIRHAAEPVKELSVTRLCRSSSA
jgi:predicted nucleic acid-binding protein